jgi:hypothetical protein
LTARSTFLSQSLGTSIEVNCPGSPWRLTEKNGDGKTGTVKSSYL